MSGEVEIEKPEIIINDANQVYVVDSNKDRTRKFLAAEFSSREAAKAYKIVEVK